jgi:type II secretory pathway pseudopilin PulG
MIKRIAAFTLVELLVVIGIIAVLISILIPALTRARQSAVSVQCMSNMKQVGQAALIYATNFKGWYPPGQTAADTMGNSSDEKFLDYNPVASDVTATIHRYDVSRLMAQYAGYKVPPYDPTQSWAANVANGYKSPMTPIFYCPADDQPVRNAEPPFPEDNLLFYGNSSGNDNGKMRYWWVANPGYWNSTKGIIQAAPYNGDVDLWTAKFFAHMDVELDKNPDGDSAHPWFDATKPCKPGLDYLRKVTDKHAAEVPIMVDRSKSKSASVTNKGGWYMMHGGAGNNSKKGWKNELFGDGHCESRRIDQMKEHYAPGNPQGW